MSESREAVAVCSDKTPAIGITAWDLRTGRKILHVPSSASLPHGLISLGNHHLVASQANRFGSVGSGSIFIWSVDKPHSPLRSYTMEAIGPICCTRDSVYLAGGTSSGNLYLWEVGTGRLLKSWSAHQKALKCVTFSEDSLFLISGFDDGMICVWSMISLLDIEDSMSLSPLFHCLSGHTSSITGLSTILSNADLTFVSSSLDGTCKVWDFASGRVMETRVYPCAVTCIALDPVGQILSSGGTDGRIFIDMLNGSPVQQIVLKGHNGSVTALSFSKLGLVSASNDCTVCFWNVEKQVIIWRFNHRKGAVTNLVTLSLSLPLNALERQRTSHHVASLLEKYPQPLNSTMARITLLPSFSHIKNDKTSVPFKKSSLLDQQTLGSEEEHNGSAAVQMRAEASMERRAWAMSMAKHVVEMNKQIHSRLLDMMRLRLWPEEAGLLASAMSRKKRRIKTLKQSIETEEQKQPPQV